MRLYGKRFLNRRIQKQTERKRETRDGILWDILSEEDRLCRVRIQGSDKLITALYPRNWSARPEWLKEGNSVKILHSGGARGRMPEVIGDGAYIPTPATGEIFPTSDTGEDGILSGMQVLANYPPSECVRIGAGSFRIDDVVYYFSPSGETMDSEMTMDTDPQIMDAEDYGSLCWGVVEGWPDEGYFRYDLVVIGVDSVPHIVTGIQATSSPAIPALPADHILLATVLLWGEREYIDGPQIDMVWSTPYPADMTIGYIGRVPGWSYEYLEESCSGSEVGYPLDWGCDDYQFIQAYLWDQYERRINTVCNFRFVMSGGFTGTLQGGTGEIRDQVVQGAGYALIRWNRGCPEMPQQAVCDGEFCYYFLMGHDQREGGPGQVEYTADSITVIAELERPLVAMASMVMASCKWSDAGDGNWPPA